MEFHNRVYSNEHNRMEPQWGVCGRAESVVEFHWKTLHTTLFVVFEVIRNHSTYIWF
jgi:hypothetical protein